MDTRTDRIRAFNDELRQYLLGGLAVITPGIAALGQQAVECIVKTIAVYDDFYRLAQGTLATSKRQPPVPIPPRLLAHLRRWHDKGIAKQHFVEFNGQPVKSVKTAFKRAVSLSKLEGKVSPHTLRHTAATWLMQIGVSTWDAAGFLGMSEKTLRDVYGHHHPDYLQGAAKAIGAKKPVSLVIPLVKQHQRRALSSQHTEIVGGGRSPSRTRLHSQIPC